MDSQIQIYPPVVEFFDAESHCVHQMRVTVRNHGKSSKVVKFICPSSASKFSLLFKDNNKQIAPGLELNALVEFYTEKEEDSKDKLFVSANEEVIPVPLFAFSPKPILSVKGDLNFGTLVADGKIHTKDIAILNHGSKQGRYKISKEDIEGINILPTEGVVFPGYSQPIRFEFMSKEIGALAKEIRISLEGTNDHIATVKANVVESSLQVLSKDLNETVECIRFGATYYGTDVVQKVHLYNSSPRPTSFVIVIDETGTGQELGIDLTKSILNVANNKSKAVNQRKEPSNLISISPMEGTLKSCEKAELYFKFSPQYIEETKGWKSNTEIMKREDYAMFVSIHSIDGCVETDGTNIKTTTEVAMTGTALPVLLSVLPSPMLKFKDCIVGSYDEKNIKLRNDSSELPICFSIRSIAHFHAQPSCGYIKSSDFHDITFRFQPNQIGNLKGNVLIEVVGQKALLNHSSPPTYKKKVVATYNVTLSGNSPPVISDKQKFTYLKNPTFSKSAGPIKQAVEIQNCQEDVSMHVWHSKDIISRPLSTPAIKDCKIKKDDKNRVTIAHPNDLSCSIRPSNPKECIKTPFTKKERYTYIDPDYSYTDTENKKRASHEKTYMDLLRQRKNMRANKTEAKEFKKYNNTTDLGMKPGRGLKSPKPTLREIVAGNKIESPPSQQENMHAAFDKKRQANKAKTSRSSNTQSFDSLSPQELFMIKIEPNILDFGDICAKSVVQKQLTVTNNLDKPISIQFNIDCKELRQTSPLLQVVAENGTAILDIIFETSKIMNFFRNIPYVINGHHHDHVMVKANIVNVGLELSEHEIKLKPIQGMPVESGFRRCIQLENKKNIAAEFQWIPVDSMNISFSIRPAKGIVEAYSKLLCEVVFYPSYSAIFGSEFVLQVEGGNKSTLKCTAEVAPTSCSFLERRLMFGYIPLNLITKKIFFIKNTSQHHSYFKILNNSPIEGMIVTPEEGSVPVGGMTEMLITYKPTDVMKFDTEIQVEILGWKTIRLRLGGEAEVPSIDLDVDAFHFAGVHCGSTLSIPFIIKNMAKSRAMLVMDLSNQKDFSVSSNDKTINDTIHMDDGFYGVEIDGQSEVAASLNFSPTEVVSYNFILPVAINHVLAPAPPPSPYPASVAATKSIRTISPTVINEPPYVFDFPTPCRQIKAIGLRAPLQFSTMCLEFALPFGYFDMNIQSAAGREKIVEIKNSGPDSQTFSFDMANIGKEKNLYKFKLLPSNSFVDNDMLENITILPDNILRLSVLFSPVDHEKSSVVIPIVLQGSKRPLTFLTIHGEVCKKNIYFKPDSICLDATPLDIERKIDFSIFYIGYQRDEELSVEIPFLELSDGSKEKLFNVSMESTMIRKQVADGQPNMISGQISFTSRRPVSFKTDIIISDTHTEYKLPIKGCADNSLLTTHSFISNTQEKYHIVCEKVQPENRDPSSTQTLLVPCVSPIRHPSDTSMSSNSTTFTLESTSYLNSSLVSSSTYTEGSRINATIDFDGFSLYKVCDHNFPESDTNEGKYLKEILKVLQRWYSSQGSSNSVCPLKIPSSLRSCLSSRENKNTSGYWSWKRGKTSYSKSIVDIVTHICCKPIPGVPSNPTFSEEQYTRVREILVLYENLLIFLRCQGAIVSSVEPAYLLDKDDFDLLRRESKAHGMLSSTSYEFMSRKTWAVVLLQIIKALVLVRITPQSFSESSLPPGYPSLLSLDPDPLCSNVYSIHERILLAWLNIHFEYQRVTCWKNKLKVTPPAKRWIVNFDHDFVDGLVLASLISAYAPYIVETHLNDLYTHPNSAEQCLHNALKVTQAFSFIGLDYDIVATDITEPVSLNMLFLVMHLYNHLPFYIPKSKIEMNSLLHGTVTKVVTVQNPSNKPITYQAIFAGKYASDFTLSKGSIFQIAAKEQISLSIEYTSRFLCPCEGILILVGKRTGGGVGTTSVFKFNCSVGTILPSNTVKCFGACYELQKIVVEVCNPYPSCGAFKILLIESNDLDKIKPIFPKQKIVKEISSKIDNGKKKTNVKKTELKFQTTNIENVNQLLSAFWCPLNEIHLKSYESKDIEIHFLPFDVGLRQCSILFLNEEIGEFLYSIEADATLPLPINVPFIPENRRPSSRISNSAALKHTHGSVGIDDCSIYLHCQADEYCLEELQLPVANVRKEQAMAIASRQRMSKKELLRRDLTCVTSSDTIIASMSKLQLQQSNDYAHPVDMLGLKGPFQECSVEVTSPYFETDKSICIPLAENASGNEIFSLRLGILANPAGQYSCDVIVKGTNDVRVYHIECLMRHKDHFVELNFESPAHQSLSQDIPVINQSPNDWHYEMLIKGDGFSGPDRFVASSKTIAMYPLLFSPIFEGPVDGELIMHNVTTQENTSFILNGIGLKPHPLDNIRVDCIVNEPTMTVLEIKNTMTYRMVFEAFSDLDIIMGPRFITVLPRQTVHVPIKVTSVKRGCTEGVIYFVYDEEYIEEMGLARQYDEDSDDEDSTCQKPRLNNQKSSYISDKHSKFSHLNESKKFKKPYRLWYSLQISALPNLPEKRFEMSCAVHSSCSMEVLLNNPRDDELKLEAIIDGFDLYGDAWVTIPPKSSYLYQLNYTPSFVGKGKASLVFQSNAIGEFWYDLNLIGSQPEVRNLPEMQCELGRSSHQLIVFKNPSLSLVEYHVTCSNTNNFQLQIESNKICVEGRQEVEIPLLFTPSSLGLANHKAEIVFENIEVCRQVFCVSGRGEPPLVYNDHVINAELGGNASTIVVFCNPFDDDIEVDVKLKQRISSAALGSHNNWDTSLFTLLLKMTSGIVLKPRTTLDIPISYAPDTMQKHEAICTIMTKKHLQNNSEGRGSHNKLTWTYHIHGIPISTPVSLQDAPVFKCRARERIEEKLEVCFANVNVSTAQTHILASYHPIRKIGEGASETQSRGLDNFNESITYELNYEDVISESDMIKSTVVNLVNKLFDPVTGIVTLMFEFVLSPSRSFSHFVYLTITSPRGGVWKYPLKFVSTEPVPDDTIVIQSNGLAKESFVSFRLFGNSSSEEENEFEARLVPTTNVFKVNPLSGILSSDQNDGTLFTIIYKPTAYGKTHKTKLIVETKTFQWIYEIHGVTPEYIAPTPVAAIDSRQLHVLKKYSSKRKNHVRDNLRVGKTAVSSPLKRTNVTTNRI